MKQSNSLFIVKPLEITMLLVCGVIFAFLYGISVHTKTELAKTTHQYLTFAGDTIRTNFALNPIVSPDEIIWEAENRFVEDEARLNLIIETSKQQLELGIAPEGGEEDAALIPLGPNQRSFVEERLENALQELDILIEDRAQAVAEAVKKRDIKLVEIINERHRDVLRSVNMLFEIQGPFFFMYYPESQELYTAEALPEEKSQEVISMLNPSRKNDIQSIISVINIDRNIRLGCYVPANYYNQSLADIAIDIIPFLVVLLIFLMTIKCSFETSVMQEYKMEDLALRLDEARRRATYMKDESEQEVQTEEAEHLHDFAESEFFAMYMPQGRPKSGNIFGPSSADSASQAIVGVGDGEHGVRYGAFWVANFLSLKTTPIRVQLDKFTSSPNRTMLLQMLQELWLKSKFLHAPIYIAQIDVDNLESVNRNLGYTVGNMVLLGMVEIFQKNLGDSGIVGRLSSDNCICLYVGLEEEFKAILEATLKEINTIDFEGSKLFTPSASIGATQLRDSDLSPEDGLRRSLSALYQAKTDGKNCYHYI